MARQRDENRDKAKQLFLESEGTLSNPEIAKALGIESDKVKKWKCVDKWNDALAKKPKPRGGQKGNKNAAGHGAPKGNRNAETHGAYSRVHYEELTEEEREYIDNLQLSAMDNMLFELRGLMAKEMYLKNRIKQYNEADTNILYTDKVVEMRTPPVDKGEDFDPYGPSEPTQRKTAPELKVSMETIVKSSAFERSMKLEAELNKTQGRILKLIDSIKSYELESRRIQLEEKRYTLMKQKLSGVYDVDIDTGELDDTFTQEDIDMDSEINVEV